jgi:RNA-directed DNA polymerase
VVRDHKATSQTALLIALNPIIRGWATYYRTVVANEIFASCDYRLMSTLQYWAGRRHGHKSRRWVCVPQVLAPRRYWPTGVLNTSRFAPGAPRGYTYPTPRESARHRQPVQR